MPQKKIREIIRHISSFLQHKEIDIQHIILFGSYAKNKQSKDSDVDIAIVSRSFEGKNIFKRVEMLRGLEWSLVDDFILPFDIVTLSSNEWKRSSSLLAQFVREGKILV